MASEFPLITGRGGDDGGSPRRPIELPNSLQSKATARIIDILSEGPVVGLLNGLKSTKLNGTPLQGPDSSPGVATYNFRAINIQTRRGTQDQRAIGGFAATESEIPSGVELLHAAPNIVTVSDSTIDRCRLLLSFQNGLTKQEGNGDIVGSLVDIKVEVRSNGGAWVTDRTERISGKTYSRYQRSVTVGLRAYGPAPWDIRLTRMTQDPPNIQTNNRSYLASYTLVKDGKLRYPNTAVAGIEADAISFSAVPVRSYVLKGMIVKVPSNYTPRDYDPETDTWTPASYTGEWDGTFKLAWTHNPAWCFYDILTERRYGLGEYIDESMVDKWGLYNVGKYCDELVPDGNGGMEPRFTCNLCLNSQEDAYAVVSAFAAIFRGMAYWAGGQIYTAQDRPSDADYLFTESNVVDGLFTYSNASRMARHNTVLVAWNDPTDSYRQKLEYVEDADDIATSGRIVEKQILLMGCTSRTQARRAGLWLLATEKAESEAVTFRTDLESCMVSVGSKILVFDESRQAVRRAGRVMSATTSSIDIDAPVELTGGPTYTLWCVSPDGVPESRSLAMNYPFTGSRLVVNSPFSKAPQPESQWILSSTSDEPIVFRVSSVRMSEADIAEVVATRHDPSKFAEIDAGALKEEAPVPVIDIRTPPPPPKGVVVGQSTRVEAFGISQVTTISWETDPSAQTYKGEYRRRDSGSWVAVATDSPSFDVPDLLPGTYEYRISSLNFAGKSSEVVYGEFTVTGKEAPPEDVTSVSAVSTPYSVEISWAPVTDLDLAYYEIRVGASWGAGTPIVSNLKATKFTWQRPASGTYQLWVKARDTSDNWSVNAAGTTIALAATDDIATPEQKRVIKAEVDRILAEQASLDAQADAALVSRTAYDNAITALLAALTSTGEWASGDWVSYTTNSLLGTGGGATIRNALALVGSTGDTLKRNLTQTAYVAATAALNLAPEIVTDHTLIVLPSADYPSGKFVYQTAGTPPGTIWQVNGAGTGWVTPSVATTQLVGTLVASQIAAGAIGAAALAATIILTSYIGSSDYAQDGAGVPTAGWKLDSSESIYKLKVGSGWFGKSIRIGATTYTLGDTTGRLLTGVDASGVTAADVIWWRGNNDPTVNNGAPVIIDPIWVRGGVFAVGDRRMGGTTGLPGYNTSPYVYECTTAGAGLTTAQAAAAAYSAATSYSTGNLVNSGNRIFSSKQNSNLNHTPTVGGDAWWTDLGSIYGPQGTTRTTDSIQDGAAKWKCVGWMWTNSVATAGCKPWSRSLVATVGMLVCSDVGGTLPGYLATAEKIYGQPVGPQFDPSSAYTNVGGTRIYRCVTAGTTSASGNGPSGTGTGISDGSAAWDYWSENTGSEDRVQIWGINASSSNVPPVIYEARIQPKSAKDNLDALTHLEIEYLGLDAIWKGRSTMHNQMSVTVPSRKYYSPSTPAHIQNMVRTSFVLDSVNPSETQFYDSNPPCSMIAKLRIRLHNVSGASAAVDYGRWASQNIVPTPYANTMSSPPSGGGGGGGGSSSCPEPWVLITTARGAIPAGEVRVGDRIPTRHEITGIPGEFVVVQAAPGRNETALLTFRKVLGEETSIHEFAFAMNHRFRYLSGEWVPLANLARGSRLAGTDGSEIEVLDIQPRGQNDVVQITVEDAHTYSTEGLLSHNIKILD